MSATFPTTTSYEHICLDENDVPFIAGTTMKSRPQTALIPYESFLQLLAFKEEQTLAEFGRLAARFAGQNMDFTEAEVEADVATAAAAHHDTLLPNMRPFAPDSVIIEHCEDFSNTPDFLCCELSSTPTFGYAFFCAII